MCTHSQTGQEAEVVSTMVTVNNIRTAANDNVTFY